MSARNHAIALIDQFHVCIRDYELELNWTERGLGIEIERFELTSDSRNNGRSYLCNLLARDGTDLTVLYRLTLS